MNVFLNYKNKKNDNIYFYINNYNFIVLFKNLKFLITDNKEIEEAESYNYIFIISKNIENINFKLNNNKIQYIPYSNLLIYICNILILFNVKNLYIYEFENILNYIDNYYDYIDNIKIFNNFIIKNKEIINIIKFTSDSIYKINYNQNIQINNNFNSNILNYYVNNNNINQDIILTKKIELLNKNKININNLLNKNKRTINTVLIKKNKKNKKINKRNEQYSEYNDCVNY